jgi:hypothetical protein
MQMLLAVGQKLGEDKFVGGGGPGGNLGPRNAEQAKARIAELKADTTWVPLPRRRHGREQGNERPAHAGLRA